MRVKFEKKGNKNSLFAYYCIISIFYIYYYPIVSLFLTGELEGAFISRSAMLQDYFLYICTIPVAVLIGRYLLPMITPVVAVTRSAGPKNERVPRVFFLFQALAIISLIFFLNSRELDLSVMFNRQNRNEGIFTNQFWIVFVFFVQSLLFISIYHIKSLTDFQKLLSIIIFLMFSFLEIAGIGARRYTAAIVVFYLYRSGILYFLTITKIGKLFLIVAIIAMIFLGTVREFIFHEATGGVLNQDILGLMVSSNEFTEIGRGIVKSVELSQSLDDLKMGATLLKIPLYFIPRAIFETKPLSLSNQYDINISIFSELFINFHIFSLYFIGLLAFIVYRISRKGVDNYFGCLFAAYALDFIRADFAGIFYCIIFSIIFYYFMTRAIKNNRFLI